MDIFTHILTPKLRKALPALLSIVLVFLAGCGGGSSDKTTFTSSQGEPTIAITLPSNNSQIGSGSSITFRATADDDKDGDIGDDIEWSSSIDGQLGTGKEITVSLRPGQHNVTAAVSDSDNNSKSARITITIEENSRPIISISSPSDGADFIEFDSIEFIASATDSEDGDISGQIIWFSDIEGEIGRGSTISVDSLSPADHLITAEITDSGGLTERSRITISVLEAIGSVNLSWSAPTQNTDNSALTDLTGFKIYYGLSPGELSNVITIDSSGERTYNVRRLQPGETYYFAMTAYNAFTVESSQTSPIARQAQ